LGRGERKSKEREEQVKLQETTSSINKKAVRSWNGPVHWLRRKKAKKGKEPKDLTCGKKKDAGKNFSKLKTTSLILTRSLYIIQRNLTLRDQEEGKTKKRRGDEGHGKPLKRREEVRNRTV